MDLMTAVFGGILLAAFTAIQTWITHGRFGVVSQRFDDVSQRFDDVSQRFDRLEGRMDAHEASNERRFEQVTAEIAQLRSDLLQVVLALGPGRETA